MREQLRLSLPAVPTSDTVIINGRCTVRREGDYRVVVVAGLSVHHYSSHDAVAEAYAMVFLVDAGYATQTEVARAFGRSDRTVRRHQTRYADGGMAALATRSGWRPGRRRIPTTRLRLLERLRAQGMSNREIAQRLGVTERAIRKQVGPSQGVEPPEQTTLAVSPPAPVPSPSPSPPVVRAREAEVPRGAPAPRENRPPPEPPSSQPSTDKSRSR